jgi:GTP cyclohydrolase I
MDESKLKETYSGLLDEIDINWKRNNNLIGTPDRLVRSLKEKIMPICEIEETCKSLLSVAFESTYDGMVIVSPITAFSLCPHHLEIVEYVVHFGYISNKNTHVFGFSKIPRVVQLFAKQAILQETFTKNLGDFIFESSGGLAEGLGLVVIGKHNCVSCRGVLNQNVRFTTSYLCGSFFNHPHVKQEFFTLCGLGK